LAFSNSSFEFFVLRIFVLAELPTESHNWSIHLAQHKIPDILG